MFPEADIPCVQLSLLSSLESEKHIRIGTALSNIARDNMVVLVSRFSLLVKTVDLDNGEPRF